MDRLKRVAKYLCACLTLAVSMIAAYGAVEAGFTWLSFGYTVLFCVLLDTAAWIKRDRSLPVCYWCKGTMRSSELCVTRYGKAVHHDCYLEERKGWELCEDDGR